MKRPIPRTGLTLLECLIVIGIVAVLIGLLLPAVNLVRAAALRSRCANNVRQIGVALHAYHGAENVFPPGCSVEMGKSLQPYMSWQTRLLPYLEQEALWKEAVAAYAAAPFFLDPPHHPILRQVIPSFVCPLDVNAGKVWDFGTFQVAFTSYLGVSGVNHTSENGVLYLDSRVRIADIGDGTSNTLAVGERPPAPITPSAGGMRVGDRTRPAPSRVIWGCARSTSILSTPPSAPAAHTNSRPEARRTIAMRSTSGVTIRGARTS